MYPRLLDPLFRSMRDNVLLLGPRQTGKSTLLGGLRPDLTINLADPETFREYVSHPERLSRLLRGARPDLRTVLIDEVQHVPALLDAVQVLIDEDRGRFRFLLSGSSARKLRRGQANLLPGRVIVLSLHPLVAAEMGGEFDLDRCLAHGSLPGIYVEGHDRSRARQLRAYANTYVREEVQAEALVRDLGGFTRILDLVAASSGRILNVNALSQDTGIAFDTARRYIGVLEDTLVAFRVPAWRGTDRASTVAHAKLFLFDVGVRNALLRRPLDAPLPDERGLLFEHFVTYEIYRRLGELWPDAALYHFRTRHGAEVDLVVESGRELWAIEVKSSTDVSTRDLRGLRAFAGRVSAVRRKTVVYLGRHRQQIEDIEVLPLADFLEELPT